jgi:hypothetical protein
MNNNINKFEANRIQNIKSILKYYDEQIPDEQIKKIHNKFKKTKYYNFIRTEQIELGMIIRTVDLNITKINLPGIVVSIKETSSKKIGKVLLYNSTKNIYWYINPDKYYLFFIEKYEDIQKKILLHDLISDYKTKIKDYIENDTEDNIEDDI